jgi:hypothetical protein
MAQANNSAESVFDIQCRNDGLSWFYSRGNSIVRWGQPRRITKPNTTTEEGDEFGWGWWSPTDFLVSQYEAGDPRYKATVLEETDSILIFYNGGNIWARPNYKLTTEAMNIKRNQRKYECSPDEFPSSASWKEGPTNIKLIRYADVVLFAAEAYFETGDNANALRCLNLVRTRARLSGDTNVPADLTGTVTHDHIVKERLVELACEGHRFFDLVRWDLAEQYLNHTHANGEDIVYVKGLHEFFPLPATEVALSKGGLQQYPGW